MFQNMWKSKLIIIITKTKTLYYYSNLGQKFWICLWEEEKFIQSKYSNLVAEFNLQIVGFLGKLWVKSWQDLATVVACDILTLLYKTHTCYLHIIIFREIIGKILTGPGNSGCVRHPDFIIQNTHLLLTHYYI